MNIYDHSALTEHNGLRRETWRAIVNWALLQERPLTILETGTARPNCNGSTWLFLELARKRDWPTYIYSVDINPQQIVIGELIEGSHYLKIIKEDSLIYIAKLFQGIIDILYLDSLDIDFDDMSTCANHTYLELFLALPKLSEHCLVAIDDTPREKQFVPPWWPENGRRVYPCGKGAYCVSKDWARLRPFEVVNTWHEYQLVWELKDRIKRSNP